MNRSFLVLVAALLGILTGLAAADVQKQSAEDRGAFCGEVESGLQDEMSEGFVNCFSPDQIDFRLRESIRNETSATCICRRKVGDTVRQVNIAQPE